MQFMPDSLLWLQPVIIAALVVFVVDLIGNIISFSSRITNALVTAIIFGLIFGGLVYANIGGVRMDLPSSAVIGEKAKELQKEMKGTVDAMKDRVNDMRSNDPAPTPAPEGPKQ